MNLSSIAFWSGVAILVMVAIRMFLDWRREPRTFFDIVRNPGGFGSSRPDEDELRRQIEMAGAWDDAKIAQETRDWVMSKREDHEDWMKGKFLNAHGERTHATVLAMLRDAELRSALTTQIGKGIDAHAPFERACDLLGDAPPTEAVSVLAPFVSDPDKETRKHAALVLGKSGDASAAEHLKAALRDDDEYVCSLALMGLGFAIKEGRIDPALGEALFPEVARLLTNAQNTDYSPEILIGLDRDRAREFFLSSLFVSAGYSEAHKVVKACNEAKILLPRERLKDLIRESEPKPLKYPVPYTLVEALVAVGLHRHNEDRAFVERWTDSDDDDVAHGALRGLLAMVGLEDYRTRTWEKKNTHGYDALSPREKYASALQYLDADICNGGFTQAFYNASVHNFPDALAGLKAMGSVERLGILERALAKFGPDGVSIDHSRRQRQLAKLMRWSDTVFDSLDSEYYACRESVDVMVARFVLAHPDDFA